MSSNQFHPLRHAIAEGASNERSLRSAAGSGMPSPMWTRAFSRRRFVGTAAGAAGALLSAGIWRPVRADNPHPSTADPVPIPITTTPFHFNFPGPADQGHELSTINDFNGFVGGADGFVNGTGTNTSTGETTPYRFHFDMRFMKGVYVGLDGETHQGAFGFI